MHLEFGFDSQSAAHTFPYSSTAEQRAVNSKVPRSNRGGGVGKTLVFPNYVLGGIPSGFVRDCPL